MPNTRSTLAQPTPYTQAFFKVVIGLSHGGHSALAASRVALARASCTRTNGARPQIAASCPPPALPKLPGVPAESVASHLSVCAGRSSEAAMHDKASDISALTVPGQF